MPSARVAGGETGPHSVPGGETVTVRYYRTTYSNLPNRSSLTNTIPRPGLVANLPWHFFVLTDAVFQSMDTPARDNAYAAFASWVEAFDGVLANRSLASLEVLIRVSDAACGGALAVP
jgi:hypothetical protein